VIVEFDAAATAADRAALRRSVGASASRPIGAPGGAELLTLESGASAAQAVVALEQSGQVKYAQRNGLVHLYAAPNDSFFGSQWALHNPGSTSAQTADADIDALEAWDTQVGSPSVTIGVIDSGVDYTHPDLAPNMWTNPNEVANGLDDDANGYVDDIRGVDTTVADKTSAAAVDPGPLTAHGTGVASIAAARGNNNHSISGVSQQSKILPVQVFQLVEVEGQLVAQADQAQILEGIEYAVAKQARIINGSFGGPAEYPALTSYIAQHPEVAFIFAAGNDAANVDQTPTWPCATPGENVICVGATDAHDRRAAFSNYGPNSVDLSAPGVEVLGLAPSDPASPFDQIAWGWNGTSMSAPVVAGVAALIRSASPSLTGAAIKSRLLATADPTIPAPGSSTANGRVNARNALLNLTPSTPSSPATVSIASGTLSYAASPGGASVVDASVSGSTYRIKDARVNLTAGAGCTSLSAREVSCPVAGVTAAAFTMGDLNDGLTSSLSIPVSFDGGDGVDYASTGDGADTLTGGNGADWLAGGAGTDTINGGAGDDWIRGNDGADAIQAGGDDDNFAGGPGNDTISAGAGNDYQDFSDEDGDDVIYGDAGVDTLQAGDGYDRVYGGDDGDSVHTGPGTGNEIADGGAGDDTLINTTSQTQQFVGGPGIDRVDYEYPIDGQGRSVELGTSTGNGNVGENDAVGGDIESVLGSRESDDLRSGSTAATLLGNDGDDSLSAGTGATVMEGQGGHDSLVDGPGNDTLVGGDGEDELWGSLGGTDSVDGGADNDLVYDGPGNDTYVLGTGNDSISLFSNGGSDVVAGGDGTDVVNYSNISAGVTVSLDGVLNDGVTGVTAQFDNIGTDVEDVRTGSGDDTITGSPSANVISPGNGKDTINSGDGVDTIAAQDGAVDRINCGAGTDVPTVDQIDLAAACELPTIVVDAGATSLAAVNLSTDPLLGVSADWVHWGGATGSANQRKSGTPIIGGWTKNGSGTVTTPTGTSTFSWTNAAVAPVSASSATGSATGSLTTHGFRFTVPVTANQPTTVRTHVGLRNGGAGRLRTWYTSNTGAVTAGPVLTNTGTALDRVYTISARPSANTTLTVEWALTATNGSSTRAVLFGASIYR
jgi:subtilisin family serine protease